MANLSVPSPAVAPGSRRPSDASLTLCSSESSSTAFMSRSVAVDATDDVAAEPVTPPTARQKALAELHRGSYNKRSHSPPLYFLGAGVGKLILGFGASLAVKGGLSDNERDLIIGCVLAVLGLIGCVGAAIGFGSAIRRVNKKLAYCIKTISISGALTIGAGYISSTYFDIHYRAERPDNPTLLPQRLSFLILALGTGLMSISLPNFTAYTELLKGPNPLVPLKWRATVSLGCMSPAMGLLFAGWVTGEIAHWPVAFNAALLTFAIALALAGASMAWSDDLRRQAIEADHMVQLWERQQLKSSGDKPTNTRIEKLDENGKSVTVTINDCPDAETGIGEKADASQVPLDPDIEKQAPHA